MQVVLLDHTVNPVDRIGGAAAICYDGKTDTASNIRRAAHCKSSGHLTTMRFAYATFNVSGISRVCSHQLVRIGIAGILQESQRYVPQSNVQFINPPSLDQMPIALRADWRNAQAKAQYIYDRCILNGMKKDDARYILPQGCTTQVNLCLNFQSWAHFLGLRTDKAASWEIRAVAWEIKRQLNELAPEIF